MRSLREVESQNNVGYYSRILQIDDVANLYLNVANGDCQREAVAPAAGRDGGQEEVPGAVRRQQDLDLVTRWSLP